MCHFDVMAGRTRPKIRHTRIIIHAGGSCFKNFVDTIISFAGAAGHQARASPGPAFSAGHPHSQEQESFAFNGSDTPVRVRKTGIATVNDKIFGLKMQ